MMEYVIKRNIAISSYQFPYAEKVDRLLVGVCPVFLPVDIVKTEKIIHLRYTITGYENLRKAKKLQSIPLLHMIRKLLKNIQLAKDWMWYPEEYILSLDTVCISNSGEVRIMYIPDEHKISFITKLHNFFYQLRKAAVPAALPHIEFLDGLLSESEFRYEGFISEIDRRIAEVQSYF